MVEGVISSASGKEQLENRNNDAKVAGEALSPPSVVMWGRFPPKLVLRVLLVEADDSTRQIIAALLRKCSYKVAAVADGLKAWEVLRARPCSVDLILAEVDLPLISGYALLALIMENEACNNIPVIMMSCHDSVSSVYKCMLRGATDFLVKPVRKNELRNLWQHVWRKQASQSSNAAGLGPPEESIGQKKDEEDTAENNAAMDNNSSRCVACVRRSEEYIEKGSDAQSSCTKLESRNDGDEDEDAETVHGHPQPESRGRISGANSVESRIQGIKLGEAIGASDNHPTGVSSICSEDAVPQLDLSLPRSHPDGSTNHAIPEPQLNHSEASPFSRYVNKPKRMASSSLMDTQQKDHEIVPENLASSYCVKYRAQEMHTPTAQVETTHPCSPDREIFHPIPVRGLRYESGANACDSRVHPILGVQAEKDSCHLPSDCHASDGHLDGRNSGCTDHADKKSDKVGIENPASVGNNSGGSAKSSNGHISCAPAAATPSECGNDDGALQRSLQREAALMKFRLKRKERCFEKKVRYESRKKLAEQRPRVKGQFVRQAPNDPLPQPGNPAS